MTVVSERLQAGAWWIWALTVGAVALQTTNLVLLGLLGAIVGAVLHVCRRPGDDLSWMRFFVALGVGIIVFRLVLEILVGNTSGTHVILALPEVELPAWMAGISIGGDVTAEGMLAALARGGQLAVMLAAFGVVNVLCSPYRLLRLLPSALHELSVATTVAMSTAPHAADAVQRLYRARRLRGRSSSGVRALRHIAVPVLERSLDQSITLAASMDVRGFGRTASIPEDARRRANVAMGIGFVASGIALYGLVGAAGSQTLGITALAAAGLALGWSFHVLSRVTRRTRYRIERWDRRAWSVTGACATTLVIAAVAGAHVPLSLRPPAVPLGVPDTPVWLVAAFALLLAPAMAAPGHHDGGHRR